jgi:hypothetical protein
MVWKDTKDYKDLLPQTSSSTSFHMSKEHQNEEKAKQTES